MMEDADADFWLRLSEYLSGESRPSDQAQIEAWIAADPKRAALVVALRESWEATTPDNELQANGEQTWHRIAARTIDNPSTPNARQSEAGLVSQRLLPTTRVHATRRWGAPAAAAFAVLGAAIGLIMALQQPAVRPTHRYTTAAGQQATISLVDGSKVTLAPNTMLIVDAGFGTSHRNLVLVGHAQFAVEHTAGAPFVVHARHVSMRVLGTVFDVQSYEDDRTVRVSVLSGKVAVGTHGETFPLIAGSTSRVDDSTAVTERKDDIASDFEWIRGDLVFRDTPLPDALTALGHWYDIEFRVPDTTLVRRHVTGTFAGASRSEALSMVQSVLNASMTFDSTPNGRPVAILSRHPAVKMSAPSERNRANFSHTQTEVGR